MQSEEKIPEYIENIKKEREIWNDYFKNGLLNIPLQNPKCQKNIAYIILILAAAESQNAERYYI